MGRPINPNSLAQLAKRYDVDPRTIRSWRDAGCDITDPDAVAEFRAMQTGEDRSAEPETLTEARRQKVLKETERLDLIIAREQGTLVDAAEVEKAGVGIAVVIGQQLSAVLENEYPQKAEGLTAPQLKVLGRETARNLRQQWCDHVEEAIRRVKEGDEK